MSDHDPTRRQHQDLGLRGDRFAPLAYEAMTPAQRAMTDAVMAGKRASMQGPYNVLLRSPQMGSLAQAFGEQTRFGSSLPLRLNELAILLTARFWRCQFMWHAHREIGLREGLAAAVVDAIGAGEQPAGLVADEAVVHRFCVELLDTRQVSDDTFASAKQAFGEQGVVDLMGTLSYYTLVGMALNVDRYPLPEGAVPADLARLLPMSPSDTVGSTLNGHIDRCNPPALAKPNGFSHVTGADANQMVFVSGQVAYDTSGQVVGPGDLAAQTRQVFRNLDTALRAAGSSFEQVLKFTFFVRHLDEAAVATIRQVRSEFLNPQALPASTMVGVAALAKESLLLEVEAYALKPR